MNAVTTQSLAAKQWGFEFGVDGVVGRDDACRLLGIKSERTIRNYEAKGLVRVGYRIPGQPASGVVVCRRSIDVLNRNRER